MTAGSWSLKVLERAGLVSRSRDAQRRPVRVEARPLAEATEWLESYRRSLEASFQRLDALLEEMKTDEKLKAGRKNKTGEKKKRGRKKRQGDRR